MPSKFLAELSNDFKQLFETEIGYDVIIYAGETPNVKEIHAHSNILCIRSQYFHTAFSNKWAKKINGKFILKKPNIMPHIIEIIIRFIYCGNIELKNLQVEDMLKLLLAADELNIQQLSSYIQEYLIENNADFLRQNPSEILEIIFHEQFHVVPNQKPKSDVLPSRFSKLGSSLLNSKVIPLFASWIDRKDPSYNYENLPYDFKLLHKSNQNFNNGFNATSFHRDCDNKGATIWIAKIQDSTQLIGGYNPLDWNGNCGSKSTDDSFLFNFTDITNITTARLGYVSTSIGAVYCKNNQGPSMGNLYCSNSNNWIYGVNGDCYPQLGISANITVEDVEVFQVIKRQ
ncbi:unnamed protein product [Rhizophagus irregularis]|nr:unnamed protein product [Rhizophagus irregularis]